MPLSRVRVSVLLGLVLPLCAIAQRIDSVHVFKPIPAGRYTSASANALAWQLHQRDATHTTVKGTEMSAITEAMKYYAPSRHTFGELPGLTHVAIAFTGGRPLAFGVADDMDRVIDFTARNEFRISSFTDHLRVRAILVKVLLTE